jgi:hypothetical protein
MTVSKPSRGTLQIRDLHIAKVVVRDLCAAVPGDNYALRTKLSAHPTVEPLYDIADFFLVRNLGEHAELNGSPSVTVVGNWRLPRQ